MAATAMQPRTANGLAPTAPKPEDRLSMTFTPFGGNEPIKLSVGIVQTLIAGKTKSGKTCSEDDALRFMMLCKAKGLNPFENDAYLVGYDGKDGPVFSLITSHQAFLKRAEQHPEYDGMQSGVVVEGADGEAIDREGDFTYKDELILGGWARVHFKTRRFPTYRRLSFASRVKDSPFWKNDPAGQIVKCAEADALRSSFPTLLGGLVAQEEQPRWVEPETVDAEALRPGRRKIANTRQSPSSPAETKAEDSGPQQPDTESPAPVENADEIELALSDEIDAADTKAALTQAGTKLNDALGALGVERHKRLLTRWQEQFRKMSAAK